MYDDLQIERSRWCPTEGLAGIVLDRHLMEMLVVGSIWMRLRIWKNRTQTGHLTLVQRRGYYNRL